MVRFEYHHYIVKGNESRRAAEASECASELGDFWNYHKLLFANQGQGGFNDRRLKAFAETLGLDTQEFNQCFSSGRYSQAVLADERLGRSLGISSTPTVFVNGQLVSNPFDYNVLRQFVEQALAGG